MSSLNNGMEYYFTAYLTFWYCTLLDIATFFFKITHVFPQINILN